MGNFAVINASEIGPLAQKKIFGGPSAFERALMWGRGIPDFHGIVLLLASGMEPSLEHVKDISLIVRRDLWTEEGLVNALTEVARSLEKQDPRAFFYAWGDCPLLDSSTTATLWALHHRYNAEYTFADGYPYGLTPEILSPNLPEKLKAMSTGRVFPLQRNSLFEILRQDINAFDVETHLSPKDLRMERVSISCDTQRNVRIAEALYEAGGTDAEKLCQIIPYNLQLLRSLPTYFPIQITNACPQSCSYCPFPMFSGNPMEGNSFMDVDVFTALCYRIVEFVGDAVIAPSLWGEPSTHPHIGDIINGALSVGDKQCVRVLVETSGIGWDRSLLAQLAKDHEAGRIMWIISLDATTPDLYYKLRGDGMEEAESTARYLAELFGKNCWMQAVRMNENEKDLENFYNRWKDQGSGPIIQKHDSYASYLPNLQPADLSPLDRFPCWHIKRDMCILIDGTVPHCRSDLGRRAALGNAFKENLIHIWERGNRLHEAHVRGEYPGPCANCDEYYTFNF